MPTVCLNMIVKNESSIIERMLDSVLFLIDTFCICDTGSDDDTVERIKKYFSDKNVPGKVIEEPFKDFGYNRNYAIKQAKNMADYLLFLDADMILTHKEGFNKESFLKEKAYLLPQGNDSFSYHNIRLVRSDVEIECVGYTHEFYHVDTNAVMADALFIRDIGDGGCKQDKAEGMIDF